MGMASASMITLQATIMVSCDDGAAGYMESDVFMSTQKTDFLSLGGNRTRDHLLVCSACSMKFVW